MSQVTNFGCRTGTQRDKKLNPVVEYTSPIDQFPMEREARATTITVTKYSTPSINDKRTPVPVSLEYKSTVRHKQNRFNSQSRYTSFLVVF